MKKILIIALLFVSMCLSATEYYVSPSGSNSNVGSLTSPFKTISYGVVKLKAGDILNVRTGVYNESVSVSPSGTESNRITIKAYLNEKPVIDGTGISLSLGGSLVIVWSPYVTINGFEIKNSNQSGVVFGGSANYCVVSNCTVHDVWETGIGYYGDYGLVESCTVFNACMSNVDGVYTPPEVWGAGINVRKHSSAKKNVVHDVWGEGISFIQSKNATIEDNIIYDIASVLLYVMNAQDCIVQRNFVYMTKVMGSISSVGMGIWDEDAENQNARNIIVNNIVYNTRRNLYNGSELNSSVIANNTFVNSTNYWSVQINGVSSGTFKNNIVIQEDGLPCIWVQSGSAVAYSNNFYNKAYNQDAKGTGDIIGNPLFVGGNPFLAEYYKLQSGSPAIDKGTPIVTNDYYSNLRSGLHDIGAIEYAGTTGTDPIPVISFKAIVIQKQLQLIFNEAKGNVVIYNVSGWPVYSKKVTSNIMTVDVSRYRKGVYMIRYTNGKTETLKVVIK